MSTTIERPELAELRGEFAVFRRNWPWLVLLGVALIAVGVVALGSLALASLAAAVAIGTLLLVVGLAEAIGALWYRAGVATSYTSSPGCCRS
jgi:uncharacterized membrane protein HdeD (DUF308 family)